MAMVHCRECGKEISDTAYSCPHCGAKLKDAPGKRMIPVLILCLFLGTLGVHRFYVGKIGTGILQLITFGALGIWTLIDLIIILTGNFKDKAGNKITWD